MIEENLLNQFASYNCIWTLSCLTPDELAVPTETYRRNGPTNIILRSGGSGQNKITTFYEDAIGGKLEFFIDLVNIESLVSPNQKSRTTTANFISFEVLEPYSMGLFMQTLQIAATASGYTNYISAPFMLSVEFIGYDDDGSVLVTQEGEYLRRDFPIKLTNIEFDVTTGGTNYNVEAMPWNEQAFTDDVQGLNSEISIKGATIVELLQTGEQGLTTIINGRLEELRQINNLVEADEVVITFPNDVATKENLATNVSNTGGSATKPSKKRNSGIFGKIVSGAVGGVIGGAIAGNKNVGQAALGGAIGGVLGGGVLGGALGGALTSFKEGNIQGLFQNISGFLGAQAPQNFEGFLSMITGQVLTKSNIGSNLSRIAQDPSSVNQLGRARIIQEFTEQGQAPMAQTGQIYDKKNKVMTRAKNVISNDERVFSFPAGTKTTRVIEKVILSSQWAKELKERSPDENGMIPWFKIEAETYLKPNPDQENVYGENAKVYHYKVVPYLVHHSQLQSAQQAGLSYNELRQNAKKEYNYLYTGKNKDIINFDIRFNGAFRQFIQSDAGQGSFDAKTGSIQQNVIGQVTEQLKLNTENSGTISATGATVQTFNNTNSNMGNGGAGIDNSKLRWARQFHDNILGAGSIDLVEVDLEIIGDPYYIFDSGLGNYSAGASELNITEDGSMEYQRSECDILLNFRTPLDYDENKQTALFPEDTTLVGMFSGLYRVVAVTNSFSGNQFRQTLKLLRRRGQPEDTGTQGSGNLVYKIEDAPETQVIATPFKGT